MSLQLILFVSSVYLRRLSPFPRANRPNEVVFIRGMDVVLVVLARVCELSALAVLPHRPDYLKAKILNEAT
jgi:hypothetical protein